MSETKTNLYRTKLDVVPRTVAATDKPGRRFQAHLKLRGKLADKELTRRLAEEEFNGNTSEANLYSQLSEAHSAKTFGHNTGM